MVALGADAARADQRVRSTYSGQVQRYIAQMEELCESKGATICGVGDVKWFQLRRKRQIGEVVERMSKLF